MPHGSSPLVVVLLFFTVCIVWKPSQVASFSSRSSFPSSLRVIRTVGLHHGAVDFSTSPPSPFRLCATNQSPPATMRLLDSFEKKPFDAFLGKSIKYVIASVVTIVLLTSSSPAPLYYAAISVINSAFGKLLKRIIKEPRPRQSRKSSYGMPSTHTLAAVYFCCVLYGKLDTIVGNEHLRIIVYVLSTLYTIIACGWRVTGHLHTQSQVLVGGLIGAAGGVLALVYEKPFFHLLARYTSQWPSWIVSLVRLAVIFFALPVVFKKEIIWLVYPKKKTKTQHRHSS
eukprot:gene2508-2746_t